MPLRWRALGCLIGAVVLSHGLVLQLLPRTTGPGWRAEPVRLLQVRRLPPDAARAGVAATSPAAAAQAPRGPRVEARRDARQEDKGPRGEKTQSVAGADAAQASPVEGEQIAPVAASGLLAIPGPTPAPASAPMPAPGGIAVPVYATRLPPPAILSYEMRRNAQPGSATLHWSPAAGSYQLRLEGQLTGAARGPGLAWDSAGGLDADGIAPERHTESRRGRALRAVNFQRGDGRITFSGPQTEAGLVAGAQDRLSWMLQLSGVMAANPLLAAPGAQVLLFVAGTRGDAEVWTFDVLGSDAVDLADGSTAQALHLQRLPRRPYDAVVDVWLDPVRDHLPVRMRMVPVRAGSGNTDAGGTEFVLRALQMP